MGDMPAAYRTEADLVAAIRRAVLQEYPEAWLLKTVGNPRQAVGVPDLLVSLGGMFVAFEVKNPHPGESREAARRRASPQQQHHLEALRRSGAVAGVVTSVDEALALCRRAVEWIGVSAALSRPPWRGGTSPGLPIRYPAT
jgi:hypothetical protein